MFLRTVKAVLKGHHSLTSSKWFSLTMTLLRDYLKVKVKVKCSRYRPGVAQRVGWGIALLFHDHGTRRGWVVSMLQPHFTPGKEPVPIVQEAGWAPGPVWMGRKSCPHWDLIPDRSARSQSLYRLSYLAHTAVERLLSFMQNLHIILITSNMLLYIYCGVTVMRILCLFLLCITIMFPPEGVPTLM